MLKRLKNWPITFIGLVTFCAVLTNSTAFAQEATPNQVVIKGIVIDGESMNIAPEEVMIKTQGKWVDAAVGMILMPGDELKTGSISQVWVDFVGSGEGVIYSGSHFKVKGDKTLIGIIGEIWLRVRGKFRVETEQVAAAVTGTEFSLELRDDGRVTVVVLDGSVRVEGPSESAEVKRSEIVKADPKGVLSRPQFASNSTLNRTWELAWDVRGAVSGMVAEVAYVGGGASVERDEGSIAVELEMALFKGDKLSTDERGRVEIRSRDRTALNIKGGVEGLDVGSVVLSENPGNKLWAKTIWNRVQKVVSGGAASNVTVVGGVRGAEEDEIGEELELDWEEEEQEEEEESFTQEDIELAIVSLRKIVEDDPQSEVAGEAQFLIAEAYGQLAEMSYRKLIEQYPDSEYVEEALKRVNR